MATTEKPDDFDLPPFDILDFGRRRAAEFGGVIVLSAAFLVAAALITHNAADPSWNAAGQAHANNLLGRPGALISDILLQSFGLASGVLVTVLTAWGLRFLLHLTLHGTVIRLVAMPFALCALASTSAAYFPMLDVWPLQAGAGGVVGGLLLSWLHGTPVMVREHLGAVTAAIAVLALGLAFWCHGATLSEWRSAMRHFLSPVRVVFAIADGGSKIFRRIFFRRREKVGPEGGVEVRATERRREPVLALSATATDQEIDVRPSRAANVVETTERTSGRSDQRDREYAQTSMDLSPADDYRFPPLQLLTLPHQGDAHESGSDSDALNANARMLEAVLGDFSVKGEIVKVRTGPVVTLYELEPAPGTKSARVISLSDDIARSMSAVSVRAAVVPGRNVIGIELPNARREIVYLRDLLESGTYEKSEARLPVALGKDIAGNPVVVDLTRMPHLLVAGTTGSGKSVAINTMILSLLYRLSPERCRLIMVDPKMLELSIYDGIPHLLSPVVTDPKKAVVALNWTVREMESRYRAMSKLGVRNIEGYNARLADALEKGETLKRRVQTGFDTETGKPTFEDDVLDLKPLPFIVVIIDEVADLMLVAGKEIEGTVQRLAQMARAAGIHVIMATQRPSVDVITGTIKANFPTRISFQVTSKIDSRTILGEQGAEQLLGQGDMLYMAGGGRVTRVHGPFVSDEEVEDVVHHLRAQGEPDYDHSITEEDEFGDPLAPYGLGAGDSATESGDELYDNAVVIVTRERKASTSFIQRHLKIGYNRAATIIERMEADGVISAANHVGKREVLVGDHSAD